MVRLNANHALVFSVTDFLRFSLFSDLEVSPDFFNYFLRLQPLLLNDPSLYAISAWHDNSRPGIVKDPGAFLDTPQYDLSYVLTFEMPISEAVMRSEFFPGLGWMMSRKLWLELEPVWPRVYWDDWMREEAQRKGRDSLRPEISRTTTFGEEGATAEAATYDLYWKKMIKNTKNVDWSVYPVEVLEKDSFDRLFVERLESALRIDSVQSLKSYDGKTLMLTYSTQDEFGEIALKLGLFTEWNRFPRGAYRGVVEFWSGNNKVMLAPGSIESTIIEIKQRLKQRNTNKS
jgi:alpha-1,3-mannosyl-glycoprotein beta-1,2-N-acetylglucosaminyltransferase